MSAWPWPSRVAGAAGGAVRAGGRALIAARWDAAAPAPARPAAAAPTRRLAERPRAVDGAGAVRAGAGGSARRHAPRTSAWFREKISRFRVAEVWSRPEARENAPEGSSPVITGSRAARLSVSRRGSSVRPGSTTMGLAPERMTAHRSPLFMEPMISSGDTFRPLEKSLAVFGVGHACGGIDDDDRRGAGIFPERAPDRRTGETEHDEYDDQCPEEQDEQLFELEQAYLIGLEEPQEPDARKRDLARPPFREQMEQQRNHRRGQAEQNEGLMKFIYQKSLFRFERYSVSARSNGTSVASAA